MNVEIILERILKVRDHGTTLAMGNLTEKLY